MSTQSTNNYPHILIVDDDINTLDLLKIELANEQYDLQFATSGEDALDMLTRFRESDHPIDLVLLDVMMPGINGFQVLKMIRSDPRLVQVQVMMLTTASSMEARMEAIRFGANDYLTKPWKFQDLRLHLAFLLQRRPINQALSYSNDGMHALYKSSQALLGIHSKEETLQIILQELGNVVQYDSASIMLVDGDFLRMTASVGFHSLEQEFSYEDLKKLEHVQTALQSQKVVLIPNTFQDPRWIHLANSDYIASWMGIPLIVKAEAIGLLNIDSSSTDAFSEQDIELAKSFASQAALAIDNARNLENLERQSRLTKALVQVGQRLAATRELDIQLDVVWEFVKNYLAAPMFYIGLCDHLTRTMKLKCVYDMGIPQPEMIISIADERNMSLASYVARVNQPVDWNDDQEKLDVIQRLGIKPNQVGTKSCTSHVWPLIFEGQVVGVISIQSDKPRSWDDVDLDIFSALTNLVAASANNARVFEDVEDDQSRLYSAFDASQGIESVADRELLLKSIVEKLQEIMRCDGARVILMDEHGNPTHTSRIGYEREIEPMATIRPNGISAKVFRTNIPVFIEDIARYKERVHPKMLEQGIKASACLPLSYNNSALGVLWVQFFEPHHFSLMERETLRLFAARAAAAYESSRRIHDLEQLRQAAEAFSGAESPTEVLRLIVSTAKQNFGADSIALWSFDEQQDSFIVDSSVADGIPEPLWVEFKRNEPVPGKTAYKVMEAGWLGVQDIHNESWFGTSTPDLLSRIGVKSFQGIALKVGEERLGVLYINYIEQRGFSAAERETARAFANQAALALKKAKLVDQLERAQKTAYIVAEKTTLGNYPGTMNAIVEGIQSVIGCDTVTLYSYDQDTDRFDFPPAYVGIREPEKIMELDYVAKHSVPYRIVQMNELYKSEFADRDPIVVGNFTQREDIKSFIGVPLISQGRKVGVMCLSFRHRHRFTSTELSTLELFAQQAALAIQHVTLYKTIRARTDILNALYRAGKAVTESLDQNKILQTIAEQAYCVTGIHGVSPRASCVALLNTNAQLIFRAAFPRSYLAGLQKSIPLIDINDNRPIGICGRAVKQGASQLIDNVLQDPDYIGYDEETRSELAVPIWIGDQVIGVIDAEHPQVGAFTEEDQQALEALATYAAIALENAGTFTELREAKQRVQSMTNLVWAGTVAGAWRHSIGNHSVIIADLIQLLRQDLADHKPMEDVYLYLSQIEDIVNQIQDIPVFPLSAEDGVDSILVNQLITDRLKQYRQKKGRFEAVEYIADLKTFSSISVRASREWLRRLLDNLIDNAVNAMLRSPQKKLVIRTEMEGERINILVRDTGPGIPQDIQQKLFRAPIRKVKGEKGSGLGLFISAEIARTFQGGLEIHETNIGGTTIKAWFPQEK